MKWFSVYLVWQECVLGPVLASAELQLSLEGATKVGREGLRREPAP